MPSASYHSLSVRKPTSGITTTTIPSAAPMKPRPTHTRGGGRVRISAKGSNGRPSPGPNRPPVYLLIASSRMRSALRHEPVLRVPGEVVPAVVPVAAHAGAIGVDVGAVVQPDRDLRVVETLQDRRVELPAPGLVHRRARLIDELVRLLVAVAVVVEARPAVLRPGDVRAGEPLRDRLLRVDVRRRRVHVDVEVALLARGVLAPGAEQHAGGNVADLERDSDLPPLVDQHLLDLLADLVTGGRGDPEAGADAVPDPDAVGAGDPARPVQELPRPRRVVAILVHVVGGGPADREGRLGDGRLPVEQLVDELLL